MAKIRVHELAKRVGLPTKEVVDRLRAKGVEVKSNLSSVDEDAIRHFEGSAATKASPSGATTQAPAKPRDSAKPAGPRPPQPAAKPATSARPAAPPKPTAARPTPPARPQGTVRTPPPTRASVPPPASKPAPRPPAPTPPRSAPRPATREATPKPAAPPVPQGPPKEITVTEGVTVKELAEKMDMKANDILKRLLLHGVVMAVNRPLEPEAAAKVAQECGYILKVVSFEESEAIEERSARAGAQLVPRPPVVTVMGHVDHGKTSLLDAVRETRVVEREHGGITQHIGAYSVRIRSRAITFLDTPGHEAFTLMRARGAKVTDIVILVVAADDGVMPQTVEAIDHARAAGVPMIVALNKMDKPDANPDVVKKQLADRNLLVEDWGGEVVCVPISAKQKTGIDDLLEMILLVADMQDLKADPNVPAAGTVLEAKLDRGRGAVATILVHEGTLRVSDAFIAGAINGKVRAMFNDAGEKIEAAGPAVPVEILGLQGVPQAGDVFKVVSEEWRARQIGAFRQQKIRDQSLQRTSRMTLNHLFEKIQEGSVKELPVILKADVQGSVEALGSVLGDLSTEKVKLRVVRASTGAITESDVLLATTTNAIVIGFNVRPERKAADLAEKEKVDVRLHTVVYDVTNEIRAAMIGMLEPTIQEVFLGRAEVRDTFKVPRYGIVAGCMVTEGKIVRNAGVRLLRDNVVVYSGKASSLRRFKDDVGEVKSGFECGIGLEKFNDIKPGDIIEAFRTEKIVHKELIA